MKGLLHDNITVNFLCTDTLKTLAYVRVFSTLEPASTVKYDLGYTIAYGRPCKRETEGAFDYCHLKLYTLKFLEQKSSAESQISQELCRKLAKV